MISLDSTVIIDIVNDRSPRLRDRYLDAQDEGTLFVISALVLHEFAFGAELSTRPARQLALFNEAFGRLKIEPFTAADALESSRLRAELSRVGRKVGGLDTMIAGQARAHGWSVATANLKHFERMPNLVVEDWSA